MPRGALTVHHGLAIHEAAPNLARDLRLRLVYVYRAADAHPLDPLAPSPTYARDRGRLISGARRPARSQEIAWQRDIYS